MENQIETPETHNTPEGEAPKAEETVTLSKAELEDLKHKAEVSSQNYERAKKAENRLKEIEPLVVELPPEEDEDGRIKSELSDVKQKLQRMEVIESYPLIKEVWKDFESFREESDNKGMNMRTAAKAFLIEKGLLEPQRKGLEKTTGGPRVPVQTGMSNDEVKNLRETNYKKYVEMLEKGLIKFS